VDQHHERPETRLERYLIGALFGVVLLSGALLVGRIRRAPEEPHPAEFVGLLLLLACTAYLGLLCYELLTVHYVLGEQQFLAAQGFRRLTFDLARPIRLQRWLNRWNGDGAVTRELNVEAVEWYPPFALVRTGGWVVTGWDLNGRYRAVAFRPSPRLLALLREWAVQRWGEEDGETAGL
jgi:hypothetical protein